MLILFLSSKIPSTSLKKANHEIFKEILTKKLYILGNLKHAPSFWPFLFKENSKFFLLLKQIAPPPCSAVPARLLIGITYWAANHSLRFYEFRLTSSSVAGTMFKEEPVNHNYQLALEKHFPFKTTA